MRYFPLYNKSTVSGIVATDPSQLFLYTWYRTDTLIVHTTISGDLCAACNKTCLDIGLINGNVEYHATCVWFQQYQKDYL